MSNKVDYRRHIIDFKDEIDKLDDDVRHLFHNIEDVQKECEDVHVKINKIYNELLEMVNDDDFDDINREIKEKSNKEFLENNQEMLSKLAEDFDEYKRVGNHNKLHENELIDYLLHINL